MQGGVLFLLVLGAVNLVNLLLIRASGHTKETAIRRSMARAARNVVKEAMVRRCSLTALRGLLASSCGCVGIRRLGSRRGPLATRAHTAFDGRLAADWARSRSSLGVVPSRYRSRGSTIRRPIENASDPNPDGHGHSCRQRLLRRIHRRSDALAFVTAYAVLRC